MKRRNCLALQVMLFMALCAGCASGAGEVKVVVGTDRPDGMYRCGDQALFLVSVLEDGKPVTRGEFTYTLSLDRIGNLGSGTGKLGRNATEVRATLREPGVLRCTVTYAGAERPVVQPVAAVFCPLGIQPTATEPEDFWQFWNHNVQKVRRLPMDPVLTQSMRHSTPGVNVYKISLANINGSRVYGWLGVPAEAGSYPAVLTIPGAGIGPTGPGLVTWARRGFIAMGISVHDYDVDLPAEEYQALAAGPLRGYTLKNRDNRRQYYFLRTILGAQRALDYMTTVTHVDGHGQEVTWDGENLVVVGSSQGGGLSLIMAGLDSRVSAATANVPGLADHPGSLHGRPAGWPRLIPAGGDPEIIRVAGYFDAVNFARHTKGNVLTSVGLLDNTCPSTTIFSAFNVLAGRRAVLASPLPLRSDGRVLVADGVREAAGEGEQNHLLLCLPLMGHAIDPEYTRLQTQWIMEQTVGLTTARMDLLP